ncbi:MAG: hypothetical protein ACREQ9_20905, partial [Candidatus Binatia bacterium]
LRRVERMWYELTGGRSLETADADAEVRIFPRVPTPPHVREEPSADGDRCPLCGERHSTAFASLA